MSGGCLVGSERLALRQLIPRPAFWRGIAATPSRGQDKARRSAAQQRNLKQIRYASLASTTAVNAQKEIPPQLQHLHEALEGVKKHALNYVNISRLNLAIRSLESRHPTIRVGILGLQSTAAARRLTRLLLADVLVEEGEWEKKIQGLEDDDRRGILLRYGDEISSTSTSILTTVHVPSRLLHQHNVEILISSINTPTGASASLSDQEELRRNALVPTAETPRTFRGDVSFITYPVHRAIVLAEGVNGCLRLGRYTATTSDVKGDNEGPLKLAVNLPYAQEQPTIAGDDSPGLAVLDLDRAAEAIAKYRQSNTENATDYERLWHRSGVSELSAWLAAGFPEGQEQHQNPAVTQLVSDIITEGSRNIAIEAAVTVHAISATAVQDEARSSLDLELRRWAMQAHAELRDELNGAFGGNRWAQLRWWKLLWRVDDVSMTVAELIERTWLISAEKGIIWLSGRSVQAGLGLFVGPRTAGLTQQDVYDVQPAPTDVVEPEKQVILDEQRHWPALISAARLALRQSTVPSLQATAQALLLRTITITGASAGLAGLIYLALPTASLYSVGAVAALGLVWSLRHLQRKWEHTRATFEDEAREVGRLTLKQMEEAFRTMLFLRREVEDPVIVSDRQAAADAVAEVKHCLDGLRQ